MPSPRQDVMALVREHGADLLEMNGGAPFLVNVWTPAGVAWLTTGCHSLTVADTDRARGWRTLRDELRQGTQPCDIDDCENCEETTDADA